MYCNVCEKKYFSLLKAYHGMYFMVKWPSIQKTDRKSGFWPKTNIKWTCKFFFCSSSIFWIFQFGWWLWNLLIETLLLYSELLKKLYFFLEGCPFLKTPILVSKKFEFWAFPFWFLLTWSYDYEIHPKVSFYITFSSFHTH